MSKGHKETEDDLLKKMQVFNSILSFLVGPVKRRSVTWSCDHHVIIMRDHVIMKWCDCVVEVSEFLFFRIRPKEKLQKVLERLLETYERLYNEEEVFLLEVSGPPSVVWWHHLVVTWPYDIIQIWHSLCVVCRQWNMWHLDSSKQLKMWSSDLQKNLSRPLTSESALPF